MQEYAMVSFFCARDQCGNYWFPVLFFADPVEMGDHVENIRIYCKELFGLVIKYGVLIFPLIALYLNFAQTSHWIKTHAVCVGTGSGGGGGGG